MTKAARFARRVGLAIVGFMPLAGAVASVLFVLWANGQLTHGAWHGVGRWFLSSLSHPIGAIVLAQSLYVGLQCILWQRYRTFDRPNGVVWPKVTVVIPAFNEGPMVGRSIRSVARCAYPKELLEIIVVDVQRRSDVDHVSERP